MLHPSQPHTRIRASLERELAQLIERTILHPTASLATRMNIELEVDGYTAPVWSLEPLVGIAHS